jgi:Acetyltransferase (GNAT) domain
MITTLDGTDGLTFAVSLQHSERIIGIVGLNRYDYISYMFHPEFWGQGYCSEAVHYFLEYLFKEQPEREDIAAFVFEDNAGSRKVLEKNAFVLQLQENQDVHLSEEKTVEKEYSVERILKREDEDSLRLAVEALFKSSGSGTQNTIEPRKMLRYERFASNPESFKNESLLRDGYKDMNSKQNQT